MGEEKEIKTQEIINSTEISDLHADALFEIFRWILLRSRKCYVRGVKLSFRQREAFRDFFIVRRVCSFWRSVADATFRFKPEELLLAIRNSASFTCIQFMINLHPTDFGMDPLLRLLENRSESCANLLLDQAKSEQQIQQTFVYCARYRCFDTLRRLVEKINEDETMKTISVDDSTFCMVVEDNRYEFAEYLITQKKVWFGINSIFRLLKVAIKKNRREMAGLLLRHPQLRKATHMKLVKMCVEHNKAAPFVLDLLQKGSIAVPMAEKLIVWAVRWGDPEMVRSFLEWGRLPLDNRWGKEFLIKSTNDPAKREMLNKYKYTGPPVVVPRLSLDSNLGELSLKSPRRSLPATPRGTSVWERLYTPRPSPPRPISAI